MGGQIKFIAGLLMIIIFTIAIVSYVIDFGSDNDVAITLSDDPEISTFSSNLKKNVTVLRKDINSSSSALFKSTIESGDETTTTGGQFKGSVLSAPKMVYSIIKIINQKIFGGESGTSKFGIVFTALTAFLAFVFILYLWKTWVGKNPD